MRTALKGLQTLGLTPASLAFTLLLVSFSHLNYAVAESATKSSNHGANSWSDWQQAKTFYDAGKYEDALREFKAHPVESAQYFHNLGTLYLKLGQSGPAVAYLDKANHLRPHDPEVQHNLQLAQTALGSLIGKEHLDPASSGLEDLADRVSMGEVRGALGLLALIVAALWLRAYWRTRDLKRTLLQPSGFIGLIGFAITLSLYITERLAEAHPPAYTIERLVIRSGPGDQYAQLSQVEPGVKLRLLGPQETVQTGPAGQAGSPSQSWDQIRYSADGIGWVPASSLLLF